MTKLTKYQRGYSFSGYQANNPSKPLPGPQVDNEVEGVEQSIGQIIDSIVKIPFFDGVLPAGSVGPDQISAALSIGFTMRGTWAADTLYVGGDGVYYDGSVYSARGAHTSVAEQTPDIATDLWRFLFTIASMNIPDGSIQTVKLAPGAATNSILADMAEGTVKMRRPGTGSGDPVDATLAQLRSDLAMPWRTVSSVLLAADAVTVDVTLPDDLSYFRFSILGRPTIDNGPVAYFSANGGDSYYTTNGNYRRSMAIMNGNPSSFGSSIDQAMPYMQLGANMGVNAMSMMNGHFFKGADGIAAFLQSIAANATTGQGYNQGLYHSVMAGVSGTMNRIRFAPTGGAWKASTRIVVEGLEA